MTQEINKPEKKQTLMIQSKAKKNTKDVCKLACQVTCAFAFKGRTY